MFHRTKNILDLRKNINRPLVLNGAIGSELQNLGLIENDELWSAAAILNHRSELKELYKKYLNAGADILVSNTFRTNPIALKNSKYNSNNLVKKIFELFRELQTEFNFIIAGSNAPAEDCYSANRTISFNDLKLNHEQHISSLNDYGAEIIFNETQGHFDEIKIICKILGSRDKPFVLSLFSQDGKNILSGESLECVIEYLYEFNNVILSLNCIKPEHFKSAIKLIDKSRPYGFYLNLGSGEFTDNEIKCNLSPSDYIDQIKDYITEQTVFIGSCCGSNYKHTKELRKYADSQNRN